MPSIDPGMQADYRAALACDGVTIQYTRTSGLAPHVVTLQATLNAKVMTMAPDTTSPAQDGMSASAPGQINQDQRLIIAMLSDLTAAGITLPLKRGDIVKIPMTGETLSVTRSDPYKRAVAGAIEIIASAPA